MSGSSRTWGTAGGLAALSSLALGVVVLGVSSIGVVRAWIGGSSAGERGAAGDAERSRPDTSAMVAQIDGRSLFFRPAPPPPPPPPVVVERPDPGPPPPPPPPREYGGPKVMAMVNGLVWFADGMRLGVDEEKSGVRVLGLNPPWSVRILWSGVEFDVPLFLRDRVVAPQREGSSQSSGTAGGAGGGA